MEIIYDCHSSLETACESAESTKIESVESPKLTCATTNVDSADAQVPFSPENSISPVLSWKSSPGPQYYPITPDVESPCLSFSTSIPLHSFSPMIESVPSLITEPTTGYSTPSAVFSPISYHIEPPMFRSDSPEQFYPSPSYDMCSNGIPTPTDLSPTISYATDYSFFTDRDSMQDAASPIFNSECHDMSFCSPLDLQRESLYSFFKPNHVPQYIDPSFIMKC
jgi:hypothetical protein